MLVQLHNIVISRYIEIWARFVVHSMQPDATSFPALIPTKQRMYLYDVYVSTNCSFTIALFATYVTKSNRNLPAIDIMLYSKVRSVLNITHIKRPNSLLTLPQHATTFYVINIYTNIYLYANIWSDSKILRTCQGTKGPVLSYSNQLSRNLLDTRHNSRDCYSIDSN